MAPLFSDLVMIVWKVVVVAVVVVTRLEELKANDGVRTTSSDHSEEKMLRQTKLPKFTHCQGDLHISCGIC